MDKKLVFCGGGNMAEGMLKAVLAHNFAPAENITVVELREARCKELAERYGVNAVSDGTEAYKAADALVIAVVPQIITKVIAGFKDIVPADATIISIAAGAKISTIQEAFGTDRRVVRVLPNTLSATGNGYSAVCYSKCCDAEDKEYTQGYLDCLGQTLEISEDMFESFSCFATAGPLWVYKLVEAMTDAGVHSGYIRANAKDIVLRNIIGTATLLQQSGEHPAAKVDQMTSPGGVTIECIRVLEDKGFHSAVMESVIAGVQKAESL